jgi:TRAP-type transport system small permease protein
MFFGFSDIIGRYAFNSPITGANEISVILMAGLALFSWAYTQKWEGHVVVDLVISHYSPRAKAISRFAALLLSLVLFIIIVWQSALIALQKAKDGYSLQILDFPSYPFHFFVPVAGFFMCLVLIVQICQTASKIRKGG